jgi:hypothetical protein
LLGNNPTELDIIDLIRTQNWEVEWIVSISYQGQNSEWWETSVTNRENAADIEVWKSYVTRNKDLGNSTNCERDKPSHFQEVLNDHTIASKSWSNKQ